jgi:hypothetical protein
MPERMIRQGILTSEPVNKLGWPAEVFYRRLMSVADDFGRFDGRPAVLRASLYPLKLDKVSDSDVSKWMLETAEAGCVRIYHVDGKPFVEIAKFGQRLRAMKSKCPEPPASADNCGHPPAVADIRIGVGDGDEGGDVVECVADAHTPTLEEFRGYAQGLCIPPDVVEACYHYYAAAGFCRGQTRLTNYRSLLMAWWAKEQSNPKKQQAARPRMAI